MLLGLAGVPALQCHSSERLTRLAQTGLVAQTVELDKTAVQHPSRLVEPTLAHRDLCEIAQDVGLTSPVAQLAEGHEALSQHAVSGNVVTNRRRQ